MKFSDMTDLDLNNWKRLGHIHTKSAWFDKDDYHLSTKKYGSNKFHGRFHPEIPFQMILRYTKKGETVWDCFAGSGTTIDVCKELDRKCVANDIVSTRKEIVVADSRIWKPNQNVQLVIMHPPYWNMIKFTDKSSDLCNAHTVDSFAKEFGKVVSNATDVLDAERMLVLVISDRYYKSEEIPLDFICYNEIAKFGYRLKGRIVKPFGETKGSDSTKPYHKNLWRYRALKGGFWELNLDWILVFQKGKQHNKRLF